MKTIRKSRPAIAMTRTISMIVKPSLVCFMLVLTISVNGYMSID